MGSFCDDYDIDISMMVDTFIARGRPHHIVQNR